MLLRCCLIQISMIILRLFLCFLYFCPCLDLVLFFLVPRFIPYIYIYTCDLFFIFIFTFITITHFFYKQCLFSTQPQCCLTFSWIELQMLLRCCLIHISIIILRHLLYLLYLCPCLDLGLFMSCLCDLFFFFTFISIMVNRIINLMNTDTFFLLLIF